jgi:hypothetical protein
MSVSIEQKRDFAAHVINHPAFADIKQDILLKLFNDWLESDDLEEWKRIKAKREGLAEFAHMVAAIDDIAKTITDSEVEDNDAR